LTKKNFISIKKFLDDPTGHQDWISQEVSNQHFLMTRKLASTLSQLEELAGSLPEPDPVNYKSVQQYQDTYPHYFFGEENSWSQLAVNEGTEGILSRIREFRSPAELKTIPSSSSSNDLHDLSLANAENYFLRMYLIPLLHTQLQASLVSLKSQTQWELIETWGQLLTLTDQLNQFHSLNRLCGTWQWLIHNHQNHGDHKTVMTYPPPSQFDRMDPKPDTIQITGDTVYIRWELPNGIVQEESLLFSEQDRALSGTFRNSVGPHGNITARKVRPCKEK
jgi:hypothetical protein